MAAEQEIRRLKSFEPRLSSSTDSAIGRGPVSLSAATEARSFESLAPVQASHVWSIDDLVDAGGTGFCWNQFHLARLVYYKEQFNTGIRYLLVADELVRTRGYSPNDDAIELSWGLSYELSTSGIKATVQDLPFGKRRRRIPVITRNNIGDCLNRRRDVEESLRKEIAGLLHDSPAPNLTMTLSGKPKPAVDEEVWVRVCDVGQGDSIFVKLPCDTAWLNDAYFWNRRRYDDFKTDIRNRFAIGQLDRLIISHFHADHIRYGVPVMRDLSPKEVVVPDHIHATAACRNLLREASVQGVLRVLRADEFGQVGNLATWLTPTTNLQGSAQLSSDPNEHAIAACLKTDRSRVLLPGDIPGKLLVPLVGNAWLRGGDYRLYKVTHHCSSTGNDPQLFAGFHPNDAATSCSAANSFDHPHNPPEDILTHLTSIAVPPGLHRITCRGNGDLDYRIH